MRPLGASCLDSLEDVHLTLHFDPLNLSHGGDEHTSAGHAITVGGGEEGEVMDEIVAQCRVSRNESVICRYVYIYTFMCCKCVCDPLHVGMYVFL